MHERQTQSFPISFSSSIAPIWLVGLLYICLCALLALPGLMIAHDKMMELHKAAAEPTHRLFFLQRHPHETRIKQLLDAATSLLPATILRASQWTELLVTQTVTAMDARESISDD